MNVQLRNAASSATVANPAVELRAVEKRFGKTVHVLKGVDLSVARGERVIICGPSGSGKSTAIRCMNGLEWVDDGEVRINGVLLTRDSALTLRRSTAMVFQSFNLFPHMTVLENCALGPVHTRGLSKSAAHERVMRCLSRVQVAEHAGKHPSQLSGGQQQRVAIARALAMEPEIILFDEPTSALDPEMIQEVLGAMEDLASSGMTVVCVTHEMGFARNVADRIVFMDEGRIVYDGEPRTFFEDVPHERIRSFLSRILSAQPPG